MSIEVGGFIVGNLDKPVYDFLGLPSTAPQDFKDEIAKLNGKPLDVEISTCFGGDIDAASEMYTAERSYQGGTNIRITGMAASAASIVAMGGHSEISPTARIMVHKVSTEAEGNSDVMDQTSYVLKQADKSLSAAYMGKSGMSQADALKMMKQETWLTAQQAVDMKLVDGIMFADQQKSDGMILQNAFGGLLPRSVIEKTRAMLAKQKEKAIEPPKAPKEEPKEPTESNAKAIAIANAKLNLIEKSMNY